MNNPEIIRFSSLLMQVTTHYTFAVNRFCANSGGSNHKRTGTLGGGNLQGHYRACLILTQLYLPFSSSCLCLWDHSPIVRDILALIIILIRPLKSRIRSRGKHYEAILPGPSSHNPIFACTMSITNRIVLNP